MKVYLSGPISGLSFDDAIGWTDYAKKQLAIYEIEGYRPLRGKKLSLGKKEFMSTMGYPEFPTSSPRGVFLRDRYDVESCDAMLVNLLGTERVSIGTMFEMAWASILHKPVVLVMEQEGNLHHHIFVLETSMYWVYDLDHGIELINTILHD